VREHFGSADAPRPAYAGLFAYFNLDNGGGRVRGIYVPRRDERVRPIFEAWLAPLAPLGAATVVPVGEPDGSDHVSFHRAGLPGFLFVQDPLDYRTLTHHSSMDLYDRLQPEDMRQAAAVVASVLYHAATRAEPLPRL
jgi:carboxypeptidase Q